MLRLTVVVMLLINQVGCTGEKEKPRGRDKLVGRNGVKAITKVPPCVFDDPDTSVSGIRLRNPESEIAFSNMSKLTGDSTHHFFSKNKTQVIGLTVHAGDGEGVISIFRVRYAEDLRMPAATVEIGRFETEKGIHLGSSKEDVIARLGHCFITDTTGKVVRLHYRIEAPQDSRTKLLERENMPVYYAVNYFMNDKLVECEFGFEYP